jgi:arylsulfatase A-like enzyme
MENISRRVFLKISAAAGISGLAANSAFGMDNKLIKNNTIKPNFLFIHLDQLHCDAIGINGCKYVSSPNIDRIFKKGVNFTRAYSANPVCCPARVSWFTSREPCEHGCLMNGVPVCSDEIDDMGRLFQRNGYEAVLSGKWHFDGRDPNSSFKTFNDTSNGGELADAGVARAIAGFLASRNSEKPFIASVGFHNPHDNCMWFARNQQTSNDFQIPQILKELPELPNNFDKYPSPEPAIVVQIRNSNGSKWDDTWWQYYLWSYHRYIEMVDEQLGFVLDALENSRYANNTFIIFTVDHGDGYGRHKMVNKQYLYEDVARVPLIICPPQKYRKALMKTDTLVGHVDILPTMCDYAGIKPPQHVRGKSLRPLIEGDTKQIREFIRSETCGIGRMIRTEQYKYIQYESDENIQLIDMLNDPLETKNIAFDFKYSAVVKKHQELLKDYDSSLIFAPVHAEAEKLLKLWFPKLSGYR